MKYITKNKNPKIYLLSDTHYIANNLRDNGSAFDRMKQTSAGKDLEYQNVALKAFVRKLLKELPDALVITGDLTFNGAKLSAQELAKILHPLKQAGVAVLVLPGNHDIYDGWARKFVNAKEHYTDEISPFDFKNIFSDSYQNAFHQDESSLAYSVLLNKNYRLILADSNIYQDAPNHNAPKTNGKIAHAQLNFIKNELIEAQKGQSASFIFMHHNLLAHNNIIKGGFVLDNAIQLNLLLKKYGVKIVFSGHIHAQNISSTPSICEVAQSCFSMTDQGYGIISLSQTSLIYQRHSFQMNNYLTDEERNLLPEANFHNYLQTIFNHTNENQMSWLTKAISNPSKIKKITEFANMLNWNFFIGKSNYSEEEKEKILNSEEYQLITKYLPEFKKYIDSLLSVKHDCWNVRIDWN